MPLAFQYFPRCSQGSSSVQTLQHDLERLAGHLAMLAVLAVDVEQRPVTRDAAGADTEHEAALGEVVEVGHAVRQLDRMVIGQQMRAGRELDATSCAAAPAPAEVGRADRLPRHGEVLADPRLDVAELGRPAR